LPPKKRFDEIKELADDGELRKKITNHKIDEFVKSQIGSLGPSFSGVWSPAAKFQELVASSSNSLEFVISGEKIPTVGL